MPPDALALYAAVILLLPMVGFFLSSPTFLLVGLEIPEVTDLLRGLFSGYFLVMGLMGIVAAVGFIVAGRPAFAVGAVAVAKIATATAPTAKAGRPATTKPTAATIPIRPMTRK